MDSIKICCFLLGLNVRPMRRQQIPLKSTKGASDSKYGRVFKWSDRLKVADLECTAGSGWNWGSKCRVTIQIALRAPPNRGRGRSGNKMPRWTLNLLGTEREQSDSTKLSLLAIALSLSLPLSPLEVHLKSLTPPAWLEASILPTISEGTSCAELLGVN